MCNSEIQKLDKKIKLYRAFLDFFLPSTVKHPNFMHNPVFNILKRVKTRQALRIKGTEKGAL